MSDDDAEMFRQQMGDVKPVKTDRAPSVKATLSQEVAQRRRAAAQALNTLDSNHLTDADVPLLDAYYILSFKRPGVQNGVFRKLKQGKYPLDARLDLHRMTVEKARTEVFSFIRESQRYDLRSVIIIHGRGHGSADQKAILKSYLAVWLPDLDEVQAFHSAQPRDGGVGAVYLLLKKSEKSKQENRIIYRKGRLDP